MQVAAALGDPAHRFGEQQGIAVLGDIAFGAGLDRPRGEHRLVVHAEDDDARVGLSLENAAAELEAAEARQIHVDQGDVGLVGEIGGVAGVPVRRVEHFDCRIGFKQRPAAGHDDWMIVDDENPHLPSSRSARDAQGKPPAARPPETPALKPDIDRDEGKINAALFGRGLMWRNIPLRHRLSLMFATLLLLWLAADIARILMNAGPRVQAEAVRRVAQGFGYLHPEMAREIAFLRAGSNASRISDLSARELEILRLLAQGKTMAEIADALRVSYKTVANNCTQLRQKLGARGAMDLMRIAINSKLG